MTEETTFIRKGYHRTSAGHKVLGGEQFHSYVIEYGNYAMISEDGRILIRRPRGKLSYIASVVGYGSITSEKTGLPKFFRTEEAAARFAIELCKKA